MRVLDMSKWSMLWSIRLRSRVLSLVSEHDRLLSFETHLYLVLNWFSVASAVHHKKNTKNICILKINVG
ncbi:hypothetical protein BpHYR1_041990 [Brachionus plicatilis]|uniref:Uncharacterized protein n=1 Tax=Brachionus plicatilis TaxID=10195 RepID=A0A3M7QFX8_BRAPC|nr:hypothetical protein BpHYR1_041990 [Brachionus plicatilis]